MTTNLRIACAVLCACFLASFAFWETACAQGEKLPGKVQGDTPQRYFPTSEFADLQHDSIFVPMFEKELSSLNEPVLYEQPNLHYAVRVMWMTPFYGDAILRIEDAGEHVLFTYKRRPTIAAPDTKKDIDLHGELTRDEFEKLVSKIRQENFFAANNQQNVIATDGTIWLLEVDDGGRYHAVYRIGPFSTPVQNIGRLAAKLANINIKDLE
jgi:hypothetical protein